MVSNAKTKTRDVLIPVVLVLLSVSLPFLLHYEYNMMNTQYGIWGLIYRATVIAAYLIVGVLFGLFSRKDNDNQQEKIICFVIGMVMLLLAICDCVLYVTGKGWLFCSNFAFSISLSAGFLLFCGDIFYRKKILLCCLVLFFLILPFINEWVKAADNTILSRIFAHAAFVAAGILFALPCDVHMVSGKGRTVLLYLITVAVIVAVICKEWNVFHTTAPLDTLMIWDMTAGYGCVMIVKKWLN